MLTELRDRLTAAGTDLVTIELATEIELLESTGSMPTLPAALFYLGPEKYQGGEVTGNARQLGVKTIEVQLICDAEVADSLGDQIKKALMGYQHSDRYLSLQIVDVTPVWTQGLRLSRLIRFGAEHILSA